jgi:Uncharacterised nucleotidyltransferase
LGYAAKFPEVHSTRTGRRIIPGEYNYFHPERGMILELHTELTLRHFPVSPNQQGLLDRAVSVDLGARTVPTFCVEDALVMLCVHGAKDFWGKLIWIADIAELLRSFPALDWDLVLRTAGELQARRMLHLGLALATQILGANIPQEIWAGVKADSQALNLSAEIGIKVLGREVRGRSAAQRFRFRRHMVDGTVAGWRYALRLTLAPAEEDWEDMRLPHRLTPLYVALRPFRLLRKYGWSGK